MLKACRTFEIKEACHWRWMIQVFVIWNKRFWENNFSDAGSFLFMKVEVTYCNLLGDKSETKPSVSYELSKFRVS